MTRFCIRVVRRVFARVGTFVTGKTGIRPVRGFLGRAWRFVRSRVRLILMLRSPAGEVVRERKAEEIIARF